MKKNAYHTPKIDTQKAADDFLRTGRVNFAAGVASAPAAAPREFISSIPNFQPRQPTRSPLSFNSTFHDGFPNISPPKKLELSSMPVLTLTNESHASPILYTPQLISAMKKHKIKLPDKETRSYHEDLLAITIDNPSPRKLACPDKTEECVEVFVFEGVPSITHPKLLLGSGFGGVVNLHLRADGDEIAVKTYETHLKTCQKTGDEITVHQELGSYRGSGHNNCTTFIAMDFHKGQSAWSSMYDPIRKISEKESLSLMREMASSVKKLHEKSIVHQDLNLGNMILNKKAQTDEKITLIDFEYSKILKRNDKSGHQDLTRLNHIWHYYNQHALEHDSYKLGGVFDQIKYSTRYTSKAVESEIDRIIYGLDHHNMPAEHVHQDLVDLIEAQKSTRKPIFK
jgi:hypothetical protein